MKRIFNYTIPKEFEGASLLLFLKEKQYSSQIITHLKRTENGILLNGVWGRVRDILHENDILTITLIENESSENIVPTNLPLDIVYEDEDLMVINKAADVPIHPSQGNYNNTLANAVAYYYAQKNEPFTYRCINRLDRDTTGLLIAAKNDAAHGALAAQLADHSMYRVYRALILGNLPEDTGTVHAPIGRHPVDRKRMAVLKGDKSTRDAVTHYTVLERFPGFSYVELRLETGRTHQIRVHMSYLGHPLLGDDAYGDRVFNKTHNARALSLCSVRLKIDTRGKLPEIDGIAFIGTTAKAFYSACNLSWTQAALQNYGGTLSWSSSDDYHAEVIIEAVPATCTENGLTEGSICSTCGKVLVAQETIPAMGHSIHFEQNVYETKVGSTPISIGVIADCGHTIDINVSTSEELELLASASAITSFSAKMCGIASVTVETADTFKTKADCKVIVHADNQLVMPEELKSIKAGSFAGLEAEEILLNDMVQEIGSRAFADCSTLRLINLPDEVQIANDAFDGCNQVTIICSSGSAGQFYAETNNIPYIIR